MVLKGVLGGDLRGGKMRMSKRVRYLCPALVPFGRKEAQKKSP